MEHISAGLVEYQQFYLSLFSSFKNTPSGACMHVASSPGLQEGGERKAWYTLHAPSFFRIM